MAAEKEITGHLELVYPSKYVKAADLRGKDVTVVIDRVLEENLVMVGGKRDRKAVVVMRSLQGKPIEKRWVVGKTVLRQIGEAVGEKVVKKWSGKSVTMYPTTCRGTQGGMVECIRVRVKTNLRADEIPEDMAAPAEPPPEFVDEAEGAEEERRADAVDTTGEEVE